MATVPSPRTWAVGELLTAAKLNTDLRDGINFLLNPPRALITDPTPTSISGSTMTTLSWGSEEYDNDGGHSTSSNTSRYTVQTAGRYEYLANINWTQTGAGNREVYVRKNGTTDLRIAYTNNPSTGTWTSTIQCHGDSLLVAGDYLEVRLFQNTVNTASVSNGADRTFFKVAWIGTT